MADEPMSHDLPPIRVTYNRKLVLQALLAASDSVRLRELVIATELEEPTVSRALQSFHVAGWIKADERRRHHYYVPDDGRRAAAEFLSGRSGPPSQPPLARVRALRGETQTGLADALCVDENSVAGIEARRERVQVDTLALYLRALRGRLEITAEFDALTVILSHVADRGPSSLHLARARNARGLEPADVAERMGLTTPSIYGIEKRGDRVLVETAMRYLRALGARVTVTALFDDGERYILYSDHDDSRRS